MDGVRAREGVLAEEGNREYHHIKSTRGTAPVTTTRLKRSGI